MTYNNIKTFDDFYRFLATYLADAEKEKKQRNIFGIPFKEVEDKIVFDKDDYLRLVKIIHNFRTAVGRNALPDIRNVYYDGKTTVIMWDDNTKSIVRCQEEDAPNIEHGIAMAIVKKAYGNKSDFNDVVNDAVSMGTTSYAKAIAERAKKQAKVEKDE